MRSDFVAFILTHGRPNKVITYGTLQRHGYTGDIIFLVDNEDKHAGEYIKKFGAERVVIFDKLAVSKTFDEADNFDNRKAIVYARNHCWDVAKERGYKYFIQLDDDYTWFGFRTVEKSRYMTDLDKMIDFLIEFLDSTPILSVAFSQGGDHIGGYDETKGLRRKAMNSFVCRTDRRFVFKGRVNEDVNTYVMQGGLGGVFFTVMEIQLTQVATQKSKGGMSDIYLDWGTYTKSFYTVMINPSCVKIKLMGTKNKRLHHSIDWETTAVKIIDEKFKKGPRRNQLNLFTPDLDIVEDIPAVILPKKEEETEVEKFDKNQLTLF